jgi:formate/nitrite transporter FocA (FNT family)
MMGTKKANTHAGKTFILGIMAGWYIGIASFIFLYIGGGMPGVHKTRIRTAGHYKVTN